MKTLQHLIDDTLISKRMSESIPVLACFETDAAN